ncbi:hypothetical protein GOV03_00410 [Candidatus Woesearchaeota archaeon]|nr:hypothetical protein [Candidatus Woesearchaeota archaeon]
MAKEQYDWEVLEEKYCGSDYKDIDYHEKLRRILKSMPFDSQQQKMFKKGVANMDEHEAKETTHDFIKGLEKLLGFEKVLQEIKQSKNN